MHICIYFIKQQECALTFNIDSQNSNKHHIYKLKNFITLHSEPFTPGLLYN